MKRSTVTALAAAKSDPRSVVLLVDLPEDILQRAEFVDDVGEVLGAPLLSQYVLCRRAAGVTVVRLVVEEYATVEMLPPGLRRHLDELPKATARKRKPRGRK